MKYSRDNEQYATDVMVHSSVFLGVSKLIIFSLIQCQAIAELARKT
jgi:hypothetical protein